MLFSPAEQLILYFNHFGIDTKVLDLVSQALASGGHICSRATMPAHITASALAIDDEQRVLLIKHPYLNRWLPPGGHIDAGELPQMGAVRELREEVGHAATFHDAHKNHPWPIDIDAHIIPANDKKGEPEHWHIDFRYLVKLGPRVSAPELMWEYWDMRSLPSSCLERVVSRYEPFTKGQP